MIIKENYTKKSIHKPDILAEILQRILNNESEIDQDKEHFWVIGLTSRNNIKYIELVTLGILTQTVVSPREIYRLAIRKGVYSIIIAHNHPSGDLDPSPDDITRTEKIKKAGDILEIRLLDHIIINKKKFFSFKDRNII